MLSYRHGYHAGNPADVFKHAVCTLILQALCKKEKAWHFIDTHAGGGLYDLNAIISAKNQEYRAGILTLWDQGSTAPTLVPYLDTVKRYNPDGILRYYPGSPAIARHWLRKHDKMTLSDLHTTEHRQLSLLYDQDKQVKVLHADGYQHLKASLPPHERRGFVLCDPPFELANEHQRIAESALMAWKRWPTGVFAYWYPIWDGRQSQQLWRAFLNNVKTQLLVAEFYTEPPANVRHMTGSGMIVINPPWKLDTQIEALLPELESILLQPENKGLWRVETSNPPPP